jgi:hypothetical protein
MFFCLGGETVRRREFGGGRRVAGLGFPLVDRVLKFDLLARAP